MTYSTIQIIVKIRGEPFTGNRYSADPPANHVELGS